MAAGAPDRRSRPGSQDTASRGAAGPGVEGVGQRLLVVGPSWVGDTVMAQSLLIELRRRDAAARIDVLAPNWSRPILSRMPEVREAIGMPLRHGELGLRTRWRVGRSLRSRRYDRSIVLPKSFKSALVPFFAGIPRRTGYLGEQRYGLINDVRPLDGKFDRPMVRRYLELAPPTLHDTPAAIPHPALTVDLENRERLVERLGLSLEAPVVGLVPGAEYGPAKAWPLASFAELAARLARSGYSVWVFGSENEREAGEAIRGAAGAATRNLCGSTRLEDAVDLLSLTPTVVSNDTGLMHVAAAVGSGLVAIFGSSSPVYTPPLTDRAEVLYLDLDCSPCFERTCPLGHYRCLREISVDAVLERMARIGRNPSS